MTAITNSNPLMENSPPTPAALSRDERKLIDRINQQALTRSAKTADFVWCLLSTPLGFV